MTDLSTLLRYAKFQDIIFELHTCHPIVKYCLELLKFYTPKKIRARNVRISMNIDPSSIFEYLYVGEYIRTLLEKNVSCDKITLYVNNKQLLHQFMHDPHEFYMSLNKNGRFTFVEHNYTFEERYCRLGYCAITCYNYNRYGLKINENLIPINKEDVGNLLEFIIGDRKYLMGNKKAFKKTFILHSNNVLWFLNKLIKVGIEFRQFGEKKI